MKTVRLPAENGDVYVALVHDAYVLEPCQPAPLPIDLWAMFMGSNTTGIEDRRSNAGWNAGYALQAKRAAVSFHHQVLAATIREPSDEPRFGAVQPYERAYRLLSALEAFLNAIYGCVEAIAGYCHSADPRLSNSFRDLMLKAKDDLPDLFAGDHAWLPAFYDLRSEFSHYSSAIIGRDGGDLIVRFQGPRSRLHFVERKDHRVPLAYVMDFKAGLEGLLDGWARRSLGRLDRTRLAEMWRVQEDGSMRLDPWPVEALMSLAGL